MTESARPLVIAHRGASGHRPEHTIAAYRLAIAQGADYIEPDLVMTSDGALIARHENEIGGTTDVAERFAERRRAATIDGQEVSGWFAEDFTLAEIKTLRARERLASRSHGFDGQFEIATFDEVLDLAEAESRARGRVIGVYPETKHPSYHESRGLAITRAVLETLERRGYRTDRDPIFIQSFETANLRWLRGRTGIRLIQLIETKGAPADFVLAGDSRTYADLLTPAGLAEVATWADGIGPSKLLVQPIGEAGELLEPTTLVRDAHQAGLLVHVWTVRSDPPFLAAGYAGDPLAEPRRLGELGVDGMFTDFPDQAVEALGGRPGA
ncbi:MAG: glycerophosphodiester phosphodiesterase [Gemmatimonadales bacterium]